MIGSMRETNLIAPLVGGTLMATVLLGVSACAALPFSLGPQEDDETFEANSAPAVPQFVAAPQERMPPPFEVSESRPALPMPRDKPALLLTVAVGDTLNGIAHRHGVPARTVIALNDLTHPYWLLTGQRLVLPGETLSAARRDEPPAEAPRLDRNDAGITTTEIAAPAHEVRVTVVETAAPTREQSEASGSQGPNDLRVAHAEPAPRPPVSPGPRLALADSTQSSPSSLSVLARQADATHVPLPPTRNTFLWPIEGRVISRFGSKPGGKHNDGINIAVPVGSEVRAAQNGEVAYAGNELRGYGNLVLIRHKGGWMTAYAHNDSLLVGKGDMVRRGQVISRSGKSGRVSRPQAHFEIRRNGEPQDPLRLLSRR